MATTVNLHHPDAHVLVKFHHLVGVAHELVGKLRYVDKSVLMHAYVNESSEIGYVGHDA